MNKNLKKMASSICLIALIFGDIQAQTKYWIKFNNKNGTPYTLSNPQAFLTAASIYRRFSRNVNVDQSDLPVNPTYVTNVDAVPNTTIHFVSKWINGVVISCTSTLSMNIINSFSFVTSSSIVNKYRLDMGKLPEPEPMTAGKGEAAATFTNYYGGSHWQNKQLNVDCIHAQGYRGQGMVIAVLDAGFNNVDVNPIFDSLRNRGGILGTRDFVSGGNSVYEDDSHGQAVLSCMAGLKPYVIVGSAPRANYWLLRTEDVATEKIIEEYNWIRGAEFADSVGADILTTSLGYTTFDNPAQNHTFAHLDGNTSNMSIAAKMAANKVMLVLNAAGNGGGSPWPKIGIPADADKICTVGAIDSLYNIAGFSSVGPTADGRIKPDLVSRGANSYVSLPNGNTAYSNGTSFATPILAGAMACFWQAHKPYHSSTVLDTLKHTASMSVTPNNTKGWGVPNMCAIGPFVLGLNEKSKSDLNFNVVPNPFNSNINISLSSLNNNTINIQVINTLGAVIRTITPPANTNNFDVNLSELSSGIYFVKISTSQGAVTKKVIKQ